MSTKISSLINHYDKNVIHLKPSKISIKYHMDTKQLKKQNIFINKNFR